MWPEKGWYAVKPTNQPTGVSRCGSLWENVIYDFVLTS